jgi:antitoxin component HigA of HigAB toxin-antitoxin module
MIEDMTVRKFAEKTQRDYIRHVKGLTVRPPAHSEADCNAALKQIERYFESEPKPGTPEADRFDLLALIIEDDERRHWPIEPPDAIDAIRYRMETGGYTQATRPSRIWGRYSCRS